MTLLIIVTIIVIVTIILRHFAFKYSLIKKENKRVLESLEDETVYVEGLGKVSFEDLQEIVNEVPDENQQISSNNIFSDGLMEFDGEFLIKDVPLSEERRQSIDDAFLYLQELFGKDLIVQKQMRTIDDLSFRTKIKANSDIVSIAHSIAQIMDINPAEIEIDFFSENEWDGAAGLYHGKDEFGKYKVTLLDNIYTDLEILIATIAHEFAHIKLLGEERIEENSEELTDMLPLFYGFGIFNSNAVFKLSSNHLELSWKTSKLGYLSQADWGYLFALYIHLSKDKEPKWLIYLNKTIAKDCELACEFILANPDKVLQKLGE